ncbi:hypothetical protein [Nonomuraea rosea]|uniref:hypothetical protein n=1 Tax=Nonomuraea rosea TaxID=638574 RepID=UPI0031E5EC6D
MTEQETGRGAPVRRAVPKPGTRRSAAPHQSKPRPRPDARPETGKRSAAAGEASAERSARPSRTVPRRRPARQRAPFVLLVVGLMSGGLVSLLLLNTMLAQDTITDGKLREEIAVARQENEKIDQEYQRNTQPGVIATMAANQGQHTDWDNVNSYTSTSDQTSQVDRER